MTKGPTDEAPDQGDGTAESVVRSDLLECAESEWAVVSHHLGEDLPPGSDRDRLIEAIDKAFEAGVS